MINLRKPLDFFKEPPLWFIALILPIAIASLVGATLCLTGENVNYILGYVFLGVLGVMGGYCVYAIIKVYPHASEKALKWSETHPFWNRLFREYGFRTISFTIGKFIINFAFAIYNCTVAIIIRSVWFGALTAYYAFLMSVRGAVLLYHARRRKAVKRGQSAEKTYLKDTRIYGLCGILLILLPLCLTPAIVQIVREEGAFIHTGITIYAYAFYAFYKIIVAFYNFIKARKSDEMTVRASRNINLADAMVSILALQTAMFHEFAIGNSDIVSLMNAFTGAAVCALTALTGIFMVVKAIIIIKDVKANIRFRLENE